MKLSVNGTSHDIESEADRSLLEVLREDLRLTGTRYGCGEGSCRACTVLVDGQAVQSCRTPAAEVAGKAVTTIEGLAKGDTLHPVQQVFLEQGAFQCGYCTSGMIMTLVGQLNARPDADDQAILAGMNGNLCRCCGYAKIGPACLAAAARVRGEAK